MSLGSFFSASFTGWLIKIIGDNHHTLTFLNFIFFNLPVLFYSWHHTKSKRTFFQCPFSHFYVRLVCKERPSRANILLLILIGIQVLGSSLSSSSLVKTTQDTQGTQSHSTRLSMITQHIVNIVNALWLKADTPFGY